MSPCDRSVPASFLGALTPNSILGHRSCIYQHGRSTDYFGGFSFDRFVLAAEFPSVDFADEIGVNVVLLNDVLDRVSGLRYCEREEIGIRVPRQTGAPPCFPSETSMGSLNETADGQRRTAGQP